VDDLEHQRQQETRDRRPASPVKVWFAAELRQICYFRNVPIAAVPGRCS
jgi:hypothetical protein